MSNFLVICRNKYKSLPRLLTAQAKKSGMKRLPFVRRVLMDAVNSDTQYKFQRSDTKTESKDNNE